MLRLAEVLADDAGGGYVGAALVEVAPRDATAATLPAIGAVLDPRRADAAFDLPSFMPKDRLVEEPSAVLAHLEGRSGGGSSDVTQRHGAMGNVPGHSLGM